MAVCCCAVALAADHPPSAAYVDGIEAIDAGQYKLAVEKLTPALGTDEENADYIRARGVANTLAENFRAALADLQRALRLNQNDREAELWLAAAHQMSGDPSSAAANFSISSSLPKEYSDVVYNRMAAAYWSSRTLGTYFDWDQRRTVEAKTTIRKYFPEAAHWYAQRHLATGPAADAMIPSRMTAALDRADWTAAMKDLRALRRTAPDDATLRGDWARCLLGLGDAWHARDEFTGALCIEPLWGAGYAGRAQAAAILGDPRRVAADVETATALGVTASAERATTANDEAVPQFAGAADGDLVEKALAVHRWFNARRLRYDEAYQDRIWALSDAARNDTKNPRGRRRTEDFSTTITSCRPPGTARAPSSSSARKAEQNTRANCSAPWTGPTPRCGWTGATSMPSRRRRGCFSRWEKSTRPSGLLIRGWASNAAASGSCVSRGRS